MPAALWLPVLAHPLFVMLLQASYELPWVLQDGCQPQQLHTPALACSAELLLPGWAGLLPLLLGPCGGFLLESQIRA